MLPRLATLALLLSVAPAAAAAHALTHEVERRGEAYAVRVRDAGGPPLARARYRIASPSAPERVHAEGWTDAEGWAVFVAGAPGTWRVRVADASGHGALVEVEVPPSDPHAAAASSVSLSEDARAEDRRRGPPARAPHASEPSASPPLRALSGAALLLLAFAAVRAVQRRRRPGR